MGAEDSFRRETLLGKTIPTPTTDEEREAKSDAAEKRNEKP